MNDTVFEPDGKRYVLESHLVTANAEIAKWKQEAVRSANQCAKADKLRKHIEAENAKEIARLVAALKALASCRCLGELSPESKAVLGNGPGMDELCQKCAALSGSSAALEARDVETRKGVYLRLAALLFPERGEAYWQSYWEDDCLAEPEDGLVDALEAHDREVLRLAAARVPTESIKWPAAEFKEWLLRYANGRDAAWLRQNRVDDIQRGEGK